MCEFRLDLAIHKGQEVTEALRFATVKWPKSSAQRLEGTKSATGTQETQTYTLAMGQQDVRNTVCLVLVDVSPTQVIVRRAGQPSGG